MKNNRVDVKSTKTIIKKTPVDSAALKKVKALADDVKTELAKHRNSWVRVGMKFRELVKSIEDDGNITWESAFGIKDLKQFCEKQLNEKYKFVLKTNCMIHSMLVRYDVYCNNLLY